MPAKNKISVTVNLITTGVTRIYARRTEKLVPKAWLANVNVPNRLVGNTFTRFMI